MIRVDFLKQRQDTEKIYIYLGSLLGLPSLSPNCLSYDLYWENICHIYIYIYSNRTLVLFGSNICISDSEAVKCIINKLTISVHTK